MLLDRLRMAGTVRASLPDPVMRIVHASVFPHNTTNTLVGTAGEIVAQTCTEGFTERGG